MRDLYHRHDRLVYWIQRVNIEFRILIERMSLDSSNIWKMRCTTALLLMRRQLGEPFRDVNKDDIRNVLKWMEHKSYKASTNEFRQVLNFSTK
jgi:hypothetical protein